MSGGSDTTAVRASGHGLDAIEHAVVIGLGASGIAAARVLIAAGVSVTIADTQRDHPSAALARDLGALVVEGVGPQLVTDDVDLVVPSPGVPDGAPVLLAASRQQVPVWSEPELAMRRHPRRLVAVTGTNGKTSTTELITSMLRQAGFAAQACGNIGPPVCDVAAASPPDAVLVAELSSFQLRFVEALRPEVGVLLNFSADHLDWHRDLTAYGQAKARLWHAQGPGDWLVTNRDDAGVEQLAAAATSRRAWFSSASPVDVGVGNTAGVLTAHLPAYDGGLMDLSRLARNGASPTPHHVANVAAASCAALLMGASPQAVVEAATTVEPGRHRFEVVASDARGVRYVDDSKATNVHAAVAALRAAGPAVWIGGGISKGVDLSPLVDELADVRAAVLIGEAASELAAVCATAGVEASIATSIEQAVARAAQLAAPGDTVLLAPACSSFDQFSSYQERGDRFSAAARQIADASASGEGQR